MYSEFYHLTGKPFQLTPDPRFYFDTQTHKKAMAYLTYGITQGEGFIIITGDIGAGKTTLVGHLFDQMDPTKFFLAKVVTTQLDADNTLRMVAGAFGIPIANVDKATLLQKIETFLRSQHAARRSVLLVVDEAQNLPVSALEELRMLSNFQEGDKALMQSFLLGQPEFRDQLAHSPELEQLRQRVIATHHLEPMGREEVSGYVEHRLNLVGWKGDPAFDEAAYDEIYAFSGGVPRRLNTICSRILLYGALEEVHEINAEVVIAVIDDLQRDNTPTTGPKHISGATIQSGTGPIPSTPVKKMDTPPKMAGDQAAANLNGEAMGVDLSRRLELIEEYIRDHDQTIKSMLDIMSEWADDDKQSKAG